MGDTFEKDDYLSHEIKFRLHYPSYLHHYFHSKSNFHLILLHFCSQCRFLLPWSLWCQVLVVLIALREWCLIPAPSVVCTSLRWSECSLAPFLTVKANEEHQYSIVLHLPQTGSNHLSNSIHWEDSDDSTHTADGNHEDANSMKASIWLPAMTWVTRMCLVHFINCSLW